MYESIVTAAIMEGEKAINYQYLNKSLFPKKSSNSVFIKNRDGKLYKYQGGIRRELEKELDNRMILFDTMHQFKTKKEDCDYFEFLREEINQISDKLMELDEE